MIQANASAIETNYNGYRFRSRLEARWAVFFDALGVRYEYEMEGYRLSSGNYLPDFWLPAYKTWIEIKAQYPTPTEIQKAAELRDATTFPVCIFSGNPRIFGFSVCLASDLTDSGGGSSQWDWTAWAVCRECGQPNLTWGDRRHVILTTDWEPVGACRCQWTEGSRYKDGPPDESIWDYDHTRIKAAVLAAKQARFEYGESGI